MAVETILNNLTKNEITQELLKKGYTEAFLRNKNKEELAKLLADAESPKDIPTAGARTKRIPKCEVF